MVDLCYVIWYFHRRSRRGSWIEANKSIPRSDNNRKYCLLSRSAKTVECMLVATRKSELSCAYWEFLNNKTDFSHWTVVMYYWHGFGGSLRATRSIEADERTSLFVQSTLNRHSHFEKSMVNSIHHDSRGRLDGFQSLARTWSLFRTRSCQYRARGPRREPLWG